MSRTRVSEDILRAHLAHTADALDRLAHIVARAEALAQRPASEDWSWGDMFFTAEAYLVSVLLKHRCSRNKHALPPRLL